MLIAPFVPPDALGLGVLGLATWRLSSLLIRERGPFDVFVFLRAAAGVEHDDAGGPIAWPDTTLGGLFACVWCMSVWIGLLLLGVWTWGGFVGGFYCVGLALSALAILIDTTQERIGRRHGP